MLHANLGASSAERWMECTASPSLIEKLDPKLRYRSSIYANEGSAAHCLGEYAILFILDCLSEMRDPEEVFDVDLVGTKLAQNADGDYVVYDGEDPFRIQSDGTLKASDVDLEEDHFVCDEEMEEGVRFYARTVLDILNQCEDPQVTVERRVYPIPGTEDVFGTADCIIFDRATGNVWVIDLKYGRCLIVSARENAQAMFYACGALENEGIDSDSRVEIIICQPRVTFADGRRVSDWVLPAGDLRAWREESLIPAVVETRSEKDKQYVVGDYCHWCPAVALCPLMQQQAQQKAKEAFGGDLDALSFEDAPDVALILPDPDDAEGLAKAKTIAEVLKNWAKHVDSLAEHQALMGVEIPGHKLVRRKTNRKWQDEAKTMKNLEDSGKLKEGTTRTRKIKSPAQMEKVMGKKWVQSRAVKPDGGLTLVHESDRRTGVASSVKAFPEVPEDEDLEKMLLTMGDK